MSSKKPYRGKTPAINWSLHMNDGWKAQYERVFRWYDRVFNCKSEIDRRDFMYAFFENAFHLRDWLIDTGIVNKDTLYNFFDSKTEMRLCRDLANAHKHYSINQPSQSAPPSEVQEYSPGNGDFGSDYSLVILSEGKHHNAYELATKIMASWDFFIKENLVNLSTDTESIE